MLTKHIYSNPDQYSRNNALQFNFAMKVLKSLKIDIQSRVLDIGCGDGKITSEIAKDANQGCVIGTDISYQMIEHASKTYSSQENLGFMQMDASQNKFINQFDIITSFNCLHWVKDQQRALDGISRAATSNAKVVLLLSHKKSFYHHALDNICSSDKWCSYFKDYVNPRSFFDIDVYKDMLIQSGLDVTSLVEEDMSYNFDSKESLREFFSSSMANIKQIPQDKKDEFLVDYSEEFLKQLGCNTQHNIPVTFCCLVINASKPALVKTASVERAPGLFGCKP
jgi:ubiquinone/menaquinone biosynthesis C-methylase UbiE